MKPQKLVCWGATSGTLHLIKVCFFWNVWLLRYMVFWVNHLLNAGGSSITFIVISYAFPSEYFIPPYSELSFCKRALSIVWKSLAYSFISLWQWSLISASLDNGQHPIGGTPTMANFLAPSSNKFCHISKSFNSSMRFLGQCLEWHSIKNSSNSILLLKIYVSPDSWFIY